MQRPINLVIISKKESFVKDIMEFCDENSIAAQSFSFVPNLSNTKSLVLLDIDSIGEDYLKNIKNTVICLTNNFESKDHLLRLLKAGAMTIQPLRSSTVTSSLTKYYEGVGA